jgi:hypothetical protein
MNRSTGVPCGPDLHGSTLFLLATLVGILAVGRLFSFQPRSISWWIAWMNMIASILFMISTLASYLFPVSANSSKSPVAITGTLLGAGLPGRRDLDAPGMGTCGESSAALARGRPSTSWALLITKHILTTPPKVSQRNAVAFIHLAPTSCEPW